MKTKFITLIAAVVVSLTSCSKDDDNTPEPTPAPASTGFTWRENDPAGTVNTAPTASFSDQYKTLIAKDAQGATLFEINLSAATTGTYTIGSGNAVTYVGLNPVFAAESGEVKVTAKANGKMSGTFEAFRSGNGITRIYGVFTDITVNP